MDPAPLPAPTLHSRPPPLGRYLLLSRDRDTGRVAVRAGPAADAIHAAVLTSVLNSSVCLDFQVTINQTTQTIVTCQPPLQGGSQTAVQLYFVKRETWRAGEDISQLRRLGAGVNLTVHESQTEGSSKTIEVRIHLPPSTSVNIRSVYTALVIFNELSACPKTGS